MLTVWPSIAEGFPTVGSRIKFIQRQTIVKYLIVKCSWLKVSEESLGRDETVHQTSHEHFTSVKQSGKMVVHVAFLAKGIQLSHSQGSPALPNRDHITALCSHIQITKEISPLLTKCGEIPH